MGILVPDYDTKWGVKMPVYISHASRAIRITPLQRHDAVNKWVLNAEFSVYASREMRLQSPYRSVIDQIDINITVDTSDLDTATPFEMLYAKLLEKYPNAQREDNINPMPEPTPQANPAVEPEPTPEPTSYTPDPLHAS